MSETPQNSGNRSATAKTRRAQFFDAGGQASPQAENSLSLRSYLQERIGDNLQEATTREPEEESPFYVAPEVLEKTWLSKQITQGTQLNSLDTELSAGLEQYLPTPAIRLRIIKDRLLVEIKELESRLQRYQSLSHPSLSVTETITQLKRRLETLRTHESKVDAELDVLISHGSWLLKMTAFFHKSTRPLAALMDSPLAQAIMPSRIIQKMDPEKAKLTVQNRQLQDLSQMLSERIHQGEPVTGDELSDILNQYDQTLRQVETLARKLKNRKTLWEKFCRKIEKSFRRKKTQSQLPHPFTRR